MAHEVHFEMQNLEDGSLELDFRDPRVLEVRFRLERFDVVLNLTKEDVEQMLEDFDQ